MRWCIFTAPMEYTQVCASLHASCRLAGCLSRTCIFVASLMCTWLNRCTLHWHAAHRAYILLTYWMLLWLTPPREISTDIYLWLYRGRWRLGTQRPHKSIHKRDGGFQLRVRFHTSRSVHTSNHGRGACAANTAVVAKPVRFRPS